jgi:hypothetical protein
MGAREIAVGFYRHLLAGRPVAEALFLARVAHSAIEDDTPLLFAMAGYPDSYVTLDNVPPRRKARRVRFAARRGSQADTRGVRPESKQRRTRAQTSTVLR